MYATYICVVDGTRLLVSQLCIEQNNSESVLPILNIRGIEFKGKRRPGGWKSGRGRVCERNLVVQGKNVGKQLAG